MQKTIKFITWVQFLFGLIPLAIFFFLFPFVFLYVYSYQPQLIPIHTTATNFVLIIISGLLFSIFVYFAHQQLSSKVKKILQKSWLILLLIYGFTLTSIVYYAYTHYIFESVDLSYYHHLIWQLSQFKLPYVWDMPTNPVWYDHFEPILLFIVPIYWIIQNAGVLVVIQAALAISGAIPAYLAGSHLCKSKYIGLGVATAYITIGGLQVGYSYGFHPILFLPPIFIWMYYWYIRKKPVAYFIFVLLSLFVKEEVAFIMIFWGVYLLLVKRDFKIAIPTILSGGLWYILCFQYIFPYFNPGHGFIYWDRYPSSEGAGIVGLIKYSLFHPVKFIGDLITPETKINTILTLFGAFSFLPFFFPPSLIIVIPSLLEKLLNSGLAADNGTHYTAAITGVLLVATIESVHFLQGKLARDLKHASILLGSVITYVAFFSNVLYGCATFSIIALPTQTDTDKKIKFGNIHSPSGEHIRLLNNIIHDIPDDYTIGAQYIVAPHVNRPFQKITPWPNVPSGQDIIIYDTQVATVFTDLDTVKAKLEGLVKSKEYIVAVNESGIVVLQKAGR